MGEHFILSQAHKIIRPKIRQFPFIHSYLLAVFAMSPLHLGDIPGIPHTYLTHISLAWPVRTQLKLSSGFLQLAGKLSPTIFSVVATHHPWAQESPELQTLPLCFLRETVGNTLIGVYQNRFPASRQKVTGLNCLVKQHRYFHQPTELEKQPSIQIKVHWGKLVFCIKYSDQQWTILDPGCCHSEYFPALPCTHLLPPKETESRDRLTVVSHF